jgi:C1A family cysteine protease
MLKTALPLTASFDWRTSGKVTPVKNQGPCGSCYSFASIGNLESKVLIDGGSTFDFSENNVKECEYFGSSCGGGNYWRVANFLAAEGTVSETCDPYIPGNVACNSGCAYIKTLLDWHVISYDAVPPTSILKSYIQTYGPVYTSMYAGNGDDWYTEMVNYDGSYTLYHGGSEPSNHAVMIVGWDDGLVHAGGTGGWIVKNSWGTGWGGTCGYGTEGGYFTIAYGSAQIGSYSSFLYNWQNYDSNGSLLYHDEGGYTGAVGYGLTTAWGLCKFVPTEDVLVERVEFWTLDTTTDVDVYVYDSFNGSSVSDLLASDLNNSLSLPGYHSVELASPLAVSSGNDIYAVVKITDASYTYPISYDNVGPLAPGYCYLSSTGASFSSFAGGDIGVRLRVTADIACGEIIEVPAIVSVLDVPSDAGGYVQLSWKRSIYDDEGSTPAIQRYRVWRKRRDTLPLLGDAPGSSSAEGPYEHGLESPAWEVVGTVGAIGDCCYEFTAPTHCDSSASGTCWNYFCVTAHTNEIGDHYDSSVDQGYSVNDLGLHGDGRVHGGSDVAGGDEVRSWKTFLEVPEPNPQERKFTIRFELARPDWVQLELYDVTGRRIALIADGFMEAGPHMARWASGQRGNADLSPGLYFVRLVTSSDAYTVKLALVR